MGKEFHPMLIAKRLVYGVLTVLSINYIAWGGVEMYKSYTDPNYGKLVDTGDGLKPMSNDSNDGEGIPEVVVGLVGAAALSLIPDKFGSRKGEKDIGED